MKLFHLTPLILQKLIWLPTRLCLTIFGRLTIEGLENLKGVNTNVIFASNHTSELDVFILPASLPFWSRFSPIFYVSKENKYYKRTGLRQKFYGGTFFKLWGAQPVYSGLNDYEKSLVNQMDLLRSGKNIYVFPEGGITPDGSIQEARGGVGYLAEKTGTTVIPVGISGAFRVSIADFFLRRRRIIIRFGKPVFPDELDIAVKQYHGSVDNIYKKEAEYIMGKVRDVMRG